MRLSDCRLTADAFELVNDALGYFEYTGENLIRRREVAMKAPIVPSIRHMAKLQYYTSCLPPAADGVHSCMGERRLLLPRIFRKLSVGIPGGWFLYVAQGFLSSCIPAEQIFARRH